jgi:hypothetical protein
MTKHSDDNFDYADWNSRAQEIIWDLSKDYPKSHQIYIATGILGLLLAKTSIDADHLQEGIAASQRAIENFTNECWKANHN